MFYTNTVVFFFHIEYFSANIVHISYTVSLFFIRVVIL